jgi:hypothetical protein
MATLFNITHDNSTNLTHASNYTLAVTDTGNLTIATGAALASTINGLSVVLPGSTTNAKYGEKNITLATNNFRIRYYLDVNTMTLLPQYAGINHLCALQNSTGYQLVSSVLTYDIHGAYEIKFLAGIDGGTYSACVTSYAIADAQHYIEYSVVRAATNVSADGTCQLWIDNASKETITGIDNYDLFPVIDRVLAGAVSGVNAAMVGTYYIDEIMANNDGGAIGAVPASLAINIAGDNSAYYHYGVKVKG